MSGLTAYNTEFFKLRFTDTWLRTDGEAVFGWQPAADDGAVPRARIAECRRALAILEAPLAAADTSAIEPSADTAEFTRYYNFASTKLRSILSQSLGQLCAIEQRWEEAATHWREALERESEIDGWDRENCTKWLQAAMSHARE